LKSKGFQQSIPWYNVDYKLGLTCPKGQNYPSVTNFAVAHELQKIMRHGLIPFLNMTGLQNTVLVFGSGAIFFCLESSSLRGKARRKSRKDILRPSSQAAVHTSNPVPKEVPKYVDYHPYRSPAEMFKKSVLELYACI
jgi:hypothetical protein